MKIEVRIKLSLAKLEALFELYNYWYDQYNPDSEHEAILNEHLLEMHFKLQVLLAKRAQKNTLALTGSEAMAFYQTWNPIHIKEILADLTVKEIIQNIDKKHKQPLPNGSAKRKTLTSAR